MAINKFIGFDLSGTGTTAWFDGNRFGSFKSKDWREHVQFIQTIMKNRHGYTVIYEKLTKIRRANQTSKDLVDIAKLIGVVEYKYHYLYQTLSFMTKSFQKKIRSNEKNFPHITYDRGYFFKGIKMNEHEVDAAIIYYYGRAKITGEWI